MFIVALTGGIASGKTAVEHCFARRGIEIRDADRVARDVVAPDSEGLRQVIATFGNEVLAADGSLDRRLMRERVFADPEARRQLERIIHPRVRDALRQSAQEMRSAYGLLVIPLLVESGDYAWVDRVLVVDVPRSVQISRLLNRDGITRELAESMVNAQASREQRLAIADDVIDNTADLAALDSAVETLHRRYLQLAA
ncbi:MAG: dephospho-CoA kinase [Xanthomonadales bacterium]|uniref:dephospho-CoA kinase n=1 Tax=Dokdonella sp. TaxID=2291710 RepID=UPI002C1B1A66|nr:dephospho-CoA kinase [Xanthomonadales bacterium]HQV72713.1 dephospho-CoA kinase [Dokdonella sp.]MBK7012259.1 dephospho-CoA kinase [Xanthomonadales bacterium]MBK7209673.1 dephospho-CoA kinase [Xanthomonadales bacterium]MBL0222317.1 dephospho-CoA kinase [Xanthomonadales bacterium]